MAYTRLNLIIFDNQTKHYNFLLKHQKLNELMAHPEGLETVTFGLKMQRIGYTSYIELHRLIPIYNHKSRSQTDTRRHK